MTIYPHVLSDLIFFIVALETPNKSATFCSGELPPNYLSISGAIQR